MLLIVACVLSPATRALAGAGESGRKTENVILVTIDGFRWQEIFGGADAAILDAPKTSPDPAAVRKAFWRQTPEERRETLMPFFWKTIARQGQLFGDRSSNSIAHVANDRRFSYPGYSELLCGLADPRIDSNDLRDNPNVSVLEFLNRRDGLKGKVAALGTWNRLNGIVNERRSGIYALSGWTPVSGDHLTQQQQQINDWMATLPRLWPDNVFDTVTARLAMEHLRSAHPRVLYVMFGETDEWAHAGRYDAYLQAAHRNDAWLGGLWQAIADDPAYAGKTSLVLTTDHGRGGSPGDWTSHGTDIPGAEGIWIAVIGPDTPALGVRKDVTVTQSQVAATVAALMGEDFAGTNPKIAKPLPGIAGDEGR